MSLLEDAESMERHIRRGGTYEGWLKGTEKPFPPDARDDPIDRSATMRPGNAWERARGD